ncbi:MAG: thioredoxin [Pyrinomonadaceae bacterium]
MVREVSDSSFEKEVLQSEKPVLVDFWAEWCGPCRMLAPTVEAIAEQFVDSASVVKLNVDDNPSTTGAYGIRGIPTLILFRDGKEVERVIGATSRESIARMIEKYISFASGKVGNQPVPGEIFVG